MSVNLDLFLDSQWLNYTPSEEEWQEKEDIENYIFSDFEEDIKDFPNFPRHLMQWYHAKMDSFDIDIPFDDDRRECLRNCFILAAAEEINFRGYTIDDNGIVTVDLNFDAVKEFTASFLFYLHEWRTEFM